MSWRGMAVQWATVLVLLAIVAAIQFFKPEWMTTRIGPQASNDAWRSGAFDTIDGDSLRTGRIEIRLFGIDAPEYRQTCRDAAGHYHACGKMARDALSRLITGRNTRCSTREHDRYGRQVAVCKRGNLDINREMVRQGWALAYRKHALDYVAAEREARDAKRGIWSWQFQKPEDYRNRQRALEGKMAGED